MALNFDGAIFMARFEVRQGARFNDAVGLTFSGLLAGESYFRGESLYVVHHGAGDRDVLRGRGFVYDAEGDPVGGVVTTIQPIAGGRTMGLVKGVTISFEKLMAAAESPTIRDDRALIVAE